MCDSDLLMSNTSSGSSILVLSNSLPRSVWNTWTSVSGKSRVANGGGLIVCVWDHLIERKRSW